MRKAFILLMLGFAVFAFQTHTGLSRIFYSCENLDAFDATNKRVIKKHSLNPFKILKLTENGLSLINVKNTFGNVAGCKRIEAHLVTTTGC